MKTVIWGTGVKAEKVYEIIKNTQEVVAFGENNIANIRGGISADEIPVISCFRVASLYHAAEKEIEAVVIPGTYYERTIKKIVQSLKELEIAEEDIYIVPYYAIKESRYQLVHWQDYFCLYRFNVKLAEHCNLKCKRCNNFSNFSKEDFYTVEEYEKDIMRLSALVENIMEIDLIGGEPLLNPDIEQFVSLTKKYYPYTQINVVTNGMLILQLPESVMRCFAENDVHIQITLYPVLYPRIDDIIMRIKEYGISVKMFRDGDIFGAFFNLKGDNDRSLVEGNEFYGKCVVMYRGAICRCGPGMTIQKFNQRFSLALPDDGKIDLYAGDLTGERLSYLLNQSIELCAYCDACLPMGAKTVHKWERCAEEGPTLEEYLV